MEQINFTKAAIEALPLPQEGKRKYYRDGGGTKCVRGLEICVLPNGKRTFYLSRWAHGKSQRVRLGSFPAMTIEQARKKAMEENASIEAGRDPSADRAAKRGEWTFGELFTWWMDSHAKLRRKTHAEDQSVFNRYLSELGAMPLSLVTKAELRQLHAELGKKHGSRTANKALELVRAVFGQAIKHDRYDRANPVLGVEMFDRPTRDRRLMPHEVASFFETLEAHPDAYMRDYIYLSLFTGQRQANVLAMRWEQIDWAGKIWRVPETKNGRPVTVPLLDDELKILEDRQKGVGRSPWVFPSPRGSASGHMEEPKKGWDTIRKRAGVPDLRIHDLRRSLGSWMVDAGATLPIIGQALGHKSQAATAIYARLSLDPVREAKAKALVALSAARHTKRSE